MRKWVFWVVVLMFVGVESVAPGLADRVPGDGGTI